MGTLEKLWFDAQFFTGQAAEAQSRAFKDAADFGAIIVTKMDGHAFVKVKIKKLKTQLQIPVSIPLVLSDLSQLTYLHLLHPSFLPLRLSTRIYTMNKRLPKKNPWHYPLPPSKLRRPGNLGPLKRTGFGPTRRHLADEQPMTLIQPTAPWISSNVDARKIFEPYGR